jgi:hypothetical protein
MPQQRQRRCAMSGAAVAAEVAPVPSASASTEDEKDQAAEESTNPLPIKEQLKFKPMYTFPEGAIRYKAELQFEPTLPYPGVIVPGLNVEGLWSVARLQLTGESLENAKGTAGGLEDLNFVDLAAYRWGSVTLAAGGATVFPLATSSPLGQGKWQVGPAVAFDFLPVPSLRIAALGQGLWSVAGSSASPTLAYATVQPFVTVRLPAALILSSDATMNFYWAGGSTTVPVNLGFGHAFSQWFVGTIKCQVTVAGPASDVGTIKGEVDLTFLP